MHLYKRLFSFSERNQCENNNGGCSDICLPNSQYGRESLTCLCQTGIEINEDKLTCRKCECFFVFFVSFFLCFVCFFSWQKIRFCRKPVSTIEKTLIKLAIVYIPTFPCLNLAVRVSVSVSLTVFLSYSFYPCKLISPAPSKLGKGSCKKLPPKVEQSLFSTPNKIYLSNFLLPLRHVSNGKYKRRRIRGWGARKC